MVTRNQSASQRQRDAPRAENQKLFAPKFSRMDCNISSEENSEYRAEKSNGEGTSQRWKDGRCEMVLYKCTKAAIVARTQRSQSLQDNKGTENLLVHPARRGPGMSIRGPWSRRPWRPARTCDDARRRLASESVPHTCRAESGRCLVRRNTASVARGWNLNSSESAAEPGPCPQPSFWLTNQPAIWTRNPGQRSCASCWASMRSAVSPLFL